MYIFINIFLKKSDNIKNSSWLNWIRIQNNM